MFHHFQEIVGRCMVCSNLLALVVANQSWHDDAAHNRHLTRTECTGNGAEGEAFCHMHGIAAADEEHVQIGNFTHTCLRKVQIRNSLVLYNHFHALQTVFDDLRAHDACLHWKTELLESLGQAVSELLYGDEFVCPPVDDAVFRLKISHRIPPFRHFSRRSFRLRVLVSRLRELGNARRIPRIREPCSHQEFQVDSTVVRVFPRARFVCD